MNSRIQRHGVSKVIRMDKASASFQFKALTPSEAFRRSKASIYDRILINRILIRGYRDYPEIISHAPFPCPKMCKNLPLYGYASLIGSPRAPLKAGYHHFLVRSMEYSDKKLE